MEQRLEPGRWPRHHHRSAYAAVILSGGYLEAGGFGRWRAEAGDVLIHPPFDAHQNQLDGCAWVLNIPLAPTSALPPVLRANDLDAVIRVFRRDPREAAGLLSPTDVRQAAIEDWPDLLAADLVSDPGLSLGDWAQMHDLASATVSRGFRRTFGITPSSWRVERRARSAWRDLVCGTAVLAEIAHDHGYADQAHLCRDIRALTGASPALWRRVKWVQDTLVPDR